MNNVVQHQTAIWADLKEWCDREQAGAAQARACWPEIASRMARLRRDYPSDNDFGAALLMHGIEYNAHDRAAFVWMGQLKPAALEDALARSERRSPRTFRQEVESWNDEYFSTVWQACHTASATPTSPPVEAPVVPEPQESAPVEISEQRETEQVDPKPAPLDKRMGLVQKLPEAEARALVAHYTDNVTRQMLAKLNKVSLLELATLVKSGRLGAQNASNMNKFSARALVPELPKEWTRVRTFEPTETKNVRAVMADAERFIAMREAGCKSKAECDAWWSANVTRRKAVDVTTAPVAAPVGQGDNAPVIVHGRVIWPRPPYVSDADKYPRGAAVAMFHLWQDLDRALSVGEPSHIGRGRIIGNLARWVKDGASSQAGTMLQEMAFAQQNDHSGSLETSRLTFVNGDKVA